MLGLYSTNKISRVAKAALPPRNICVTSSQTCHSCTWSKHLLPVLINKHISTLSTCSFILSLFLPLLVSGYLSEHLQLSAFPLHSPPSLPEECVHCALPSIRLVIGRSGAVGEDCVGLGSFPCSDYPGLLSGTRPLPFRPLPPPPPSSPCLLLFFFHFSPLLCLLVFVPPSVSAVIALPHFFLDI